MNKQLSLMLVAVVFWVVGMVGGYFLRDIFVKSQGNKITNFEDCVAAGYPVMESYPEQCITPDKKVFMRTIEEDPSLPDGSVACTMEAKICTDGSSVGRVAPSCEFAPCPGE